MKFTKKAKNLAIVSVGVVLTGALIGGITTASGEPTAAEAVTYNVEHSNSVVTARTVPTEPVVQVRKKATSRNTDRKPVLKCKNNLAQTLFGAGFRGENLHEAWAIAMRESNGQNLGPGDSQFNGEDWGIVQFNKPTWGDESWWSDSKILDPHYSARIMYRMSDGGRDWQMWGLTGSGQLDASMYGGWSADQQWAWIIEPYQRWYGQYPC